jgi:RNA polymerase sigma factor for flagellar operon FliA
MEPPVEPEALAKAVDLSSEELDRCLEAMRMTRFGVWDEAIGSGKNIVQNREQNPENVAMTREATNVVSECIEQLPRQERLVVTMYYVEDMRLKEIGEVLKLSESRVSRILSRAVFRLREMARAQGI